MLISNDLVCTSERKPVKYFIEIVGKRIKSKSCSNFVGVSERFAVPTDFHTLQVKEPNLVHRKGGIRQSKKKKKKKKKKEKEKEKEKERKRGRE